MTRWGSDGVRGRTAVAGSLWIGVVGVTTLTATGDGSTLAATLFLAGSAGGRSGFTRLVGWLVGGSLLGAGVGYAAVTAVAGLPLGTVGGVGLGIALGGGLGVVSNLLATDAGDAGTDGDGTESMTVDMESDDSPSPRPADLFSDHPDPTLYVADRGAGPVVLAANDAFAERFDVPADALVETPLDEALLAGGTSEADDREAVVDAFAGDGPAAGRVTAETPDGERTFRLRTVGGGADGYVLYTPVDAAS